MNMPGFTAESSVYRTSGYHHSAGYFEVNSGVVLPQQCDLGCLGECLSACVEVGGGPECRANCRIGCGCGRPLSCGPCECFRRCNDGSQRLC